MVTVRFVSQLEEVAQPHCQMLWLNKIYLYYTIEKHVWIRREIGKAVEFRLKFHFHGKYGITSINLGYRIYPKYSHPLLFTLYFSSTSPFYYLIAGRVANSVDSNQTPCSVASDLGLFAQACLSDYTD